jgi:hypothetical protein
VTVRSGEAGEEGQRRTDDETDDVRGERAQAQGAILDQRRVLPKADLILIFSTNTNCESMAYSIDPLVLLNFKLEVSEKLPQG